MRNLTLPKSFKDAAGNVQANWSHFRVNYIVLLTLVTVILMMFRSFYSFSVVVCLASVWAWTIWLRPNAEGSLKIFGKEYAPTEQRIILGEFLSKTCLKRVRQRERERERTGGHSL